MPLVYASSASRCEPGIDGRVSTFTVTVENQQFGMLNFRSSRSVPASKASCQRLGEVLLDAQGIPLLARSHKYAVCTRCSTSSDPHNVAESQRLMGGGPKFGDVLVEGRKRGLATRPVYVP